MARSFCGNAGRDGDCVGRRRRLRRLANVAAARGGSVRGFPRRHYGRCVLDEHIAERPMPKGKVYRGGAERAETEIAGGARKPRHV